MSKKKRKPQIGRCRYCNEMLYKDAVLPHMRTCKEREECRRRFRAYAGDAGACLDIFINIKRRPDDWGMIEIDENCTLEELNSYIDRMWMEDYLLITETEIEGIKYREEPDFFADEVDVSFESTDIKIKEILHPGTRFRQRSSCLNPRTLELKVVARNECRSAVERAVYPIVHGEDLFYYDTETEIPKILSREELCWETVEKENETEYLLNGIPFIHSKENGIGVSTGYLKDEIDFPKEKVSETIERLKKDIEDDFMVYGKEFSRGFEERICRKYGFKAFRMDDEDLPF